MHSSPKTEEPGTVTKGDFWSMVLRDGEYVLDYIPGELAGTAEWVQISRLKPKVSPRATKPGP